VELESYDKAPWFKHAQLWPLLTTFAVIIIALLKQFNISLNCANWRRCGVKGIARWRRWPTSGSVSTGMDDRVCVQFPGHGIYLSMWLATQVISTWPSFRGYAKGRWRFAAAE